jgi:protocatechuate 3,4-dioxygenase beta subunit
MRLLTPHQAALSRRGFMAKGIPGGAVTVAALRAMAATPGCTLTGEQEEGPYYVDSAIFRADVTEGRPGVPLHLRIALLDAAKCVPLRNATVDIWHCDAVGVYSGFTAAGSGGGGRMGSNLRRGRGPDDFGPGGRPPGGPGRPRTIDDTRFLRGVQMTDERGMVEFTTVYPGWYQGRTIHVHLKVHLGGSAANETYAGGHIAHTGQLFFPEDLTSEVAELSPYKSNSGVHRTLQSEDTVFRSQHGSSAMAGLERLNQGSNAGGFLATATLAVNPEATPAPVGGRGRGPRPF